MQDNKGETCLSGKWISPGLKASLFPTADDEQGQSVKWVWIVIMDVSQCSMRSYNRGGNLG